MKTMDLGTTLIPEQFGISELFHLAMTHICKLEKQSDYVVSLALLGAQHSKKDSTTQDVIAGNVFSLISDLTESTSTLGELKALLVAMRSEATTRHNPAE